MLRCLNPDHTTTTYAAASVDLGAALAIATVLYVEHRHAIRTSALLGIYLAIGVLIDGTKSRSYFKRDIGSSGYVAAATAAVRLILIGLEEVPKVNLVLDPELRRLSEGEATSGFFTRTLFLFLQPMLRTGFRGALSLRDLSNLGVDFTSERVSAKFSRSWPQHKQLKTHSLFIACCVAFKGAIMAFVLPRLCVTGLLFSQPYIMQSIIDSAAKPMPDESGGLVGATAFAFIGAAVCRAASTHVKNQLATLFRGAVISQVFQKSYKLKLSEAKKHQAITLMSADFDGIATGLPACLEIPFCILDACLGMYFLSRFVQTVCLVILGPLIFATVVGIMFGKFTSPAMIHWNEQVEQRVAKTARVLSQLRAIKTLGLGPKAAEFIQHLRIIETLASNRYRYLQAGALGSAVMVDMVTPVVLVTAGVFARAFGDQISSQTIYPTLGVLAIVQEPLVVLLKAYPTSMSMLGCFERVRVFLCQEENVDPRIVVPRAPDNANADEDTDADATTGPAQRCILRFDTTSIAPRGSNTPLLHNVNLELKEGNVYAMYGPTSSGKTTLLEGMLGEAEILDGTVTVDETATSIAICGEDTYLPNVTIRECIVGACQYEATWFNTVITYLQLLEDLQRIPNGEHYVIGSEGIALSGGQRKRISIARAVYARTKIIILDDSFSALDKTTATKILAGLCGDGGLLRTSNCAVVISSYLADCVQVADELILLDGKGSVFSEPHEENSDAVTRIAHLLGSGFLGAEDGKLEAGSQEIGQASSSAAASMNPLVAGAENERDVRRSGDWKLYMVWIDSVGRKEIAILLVCILILSVAEIFPGIWVRIWIDNAPASKTYLIGYALISISAGFLAFLCLYLTHIRFGPRASNGLHQDLTETVTRSTVGFISNTDSGSLLNRYSQDMELLSKRIPAAAYFTMYCLLTTLIQNGVVMAGATYMSVFVPFIWICIWLIQRYYLRTSRQLRHLDIEAQAPLVTALQETSNGLLYIRGYGLQSHSFAQALQLLDESQKPFYFLMCSQTLLCLVLDILAGLVAVILAALVMYVRGASSPNAAGLAFLNLISLGTSFNRTVTGWTLLEIAIGALDRLREFLKNTPTERKGTVTELPANWPASGEITMDNVTARYKAHREDNQKPVLREVTMHIPAGKKIGVMGRSGGGKSSLLLTLLGSLEHEGSIIIDGIDIATVDPDLLRSRIITISQDIVELDGTIRDNLLPYEKVWTIDEAEVDEKPNEDAEEKNQILRETLVRLRLWDQLQVLGGLKAKLSEVGYSRGEMQLFCIARAVVRRRLTGSSLILVDEATASVDFWLDQVVREMMLEYCSGCTSIVVAHRAESIADSDSTIYMAEGQITTVRHQSSTLAT